MRQAYDATADALYVTLADGEVARTVEIAEGTNVDLDAAGSLLGIEVLRPNRPWPLAAILRTHHISDEDAAMLMTCCPYRMSVEVA